MRLTFVALLAGTLLGCVGSARAEEPAKGMDMTHMDMPGGTSSPADKAFAAGMDKMMKDMAVKPTGKTDEDFVRMMIPHHAGAIDMAKVELRYGKDPMLLKLARGIVAAQESEIVEMKAWLAKH